MIIIIIMIIYHSQECSKCKASSIVIEIELISSRDYINEMRHSDTTVTPYLCFTLLSKVH